MKILITGGTGYLGMILKKQLQGRGHEIISLGRKNENEIVCDLSKNRPNFDQIFDVVIHASGKAHTIPFNKLEEQEFFDVNFQGTINLCSGLEVLSLLPKAFIFISTVAVYGVEEGELIKETTPLKGNTPYALSKIEAEEYLVEWAYQNKVKLSVLRLPLVVGKNPPGNLGAMILGIKSGKYLSIGLANAKKSVIFADDLVEIFEKLVEFGGIYNLTDGYHPTFGELELAISNHFQKRVLKIPYFLAKILAMMGNIIGPKFPLNSDKLKKISSTLTFDDSLAKTKLGWKPSKVVDQIHKII
jgi:nucleoside-diphosphate-sugar epimerase